MSKPAKINTLIDANPDFKDLSETTRLLKGGEVISQSDFFHQDFAFNAVKMFDKSLDTFWHCQVKNGKNKNLSDGENYKYTQDPYVLANSYTSVYQGGGSASTKYLTPVLGGEAISGSWCQITFPAPAFPSDMSIQVRKNNYNTTSQREIPKKVSIVCSDDDQDVPDNLKTWKFLATYDYGTTYTTKIDFAFSGIYGFEYFNIIINGKTFSSYTAKKIEQQETIYISGLDTLKIEFVNKKSFPQTAGSQKPGILLSKFNVNGKEMRDFIQHETRRERAKPVNGMLRWGAGYDLVAAFPGDADSAMYKPLPMPGQDHKYDAATKGCRTIRLIVQELYGGTKFNIAKWNILGTLGQVPGIPQSGGSSYFAGPIEPQGFTNMLPTIDNSIFNGIYTNSPDIKGIPLSNMITNTENFNNDGLNLFENFANKKTPKNKKVSPPSQINSAIKRRHKQRPSGKYVREGFTESNEGSPNTDVTTAQDAITMEKNIVSYINQFNAEYAKYIHCNGLHLADDKRSIKKTAEDTEGKCWPKTDFHRLITKIVIKMNVAENTNSGTNQFQSFTFLGIKEGDESAGEVAIAENFTKEVDGVIFSPKSAEHSGEHIITLKNEYDENTGELENADEGGGLHGLHEFSGKITGMRFSFGTSKLELNALQVVFYDQRGIGENVASYNFINKKAEGDSSQVIPEFKDTGSATGAASSVAFDIQGNHLSFYKNGLVALTSISTTLQNELNNLIRARNSITKTKNLEEYNADATLLSTNIKEFKKIRDRMDMQLRELYYLDGTNSANSHLTYTGTMMTGMLWTALTASILYYTFYELD